MAELLTRKGDQAEAFRTVRDDFLHRLETELGLPAGTPSNRPSARPLVDAGVDPDSLARMLTSARTPAGRGTTAFLTALHQLDTAAHECLQSRRRRSLSLYAAARREIAKVIVGQDALIEQVLVALFAGGHVLIEGVPGTAKTLLVRVLARLFTCEFKRIQFTPDLMPADIIGTNVFDPRDQTFQFRHGPIFAQFVLGDEINRAPPRRRPRCSKRCRNGR